MGDNYIEQEE